MESKKLEVSKILRISQAIDLLDTNTTLDSTISYRLGRIGDSCISVKKRLEKVQTKYINAFNKERSQLIGKTEEKDITQEVKDKITDLANQLQEAISNLQDDEDDINVCELKLSNFVAKEDIKSNIELKNADGSTKLESISIKKGDMLVPTKFFKLMGELITE